MRVAYRWFHMNFILLRNSFLSLKDQACRLLLDIVYNEDLL